MNPGKFEGLKDLQYFLDAVSSSPLKESLEILDIWSTKATKEQVNKILKKYKLDKLAIIGSKWGKLFEYKLKERRCIIQ